MGETADHFLGGLIGQFRQRRLDLEKSQSAVEGELGVADGQIAKWERGFRRPTFWNAYCWAISLKARLVLVPDDVTVVIVPPGYEAAVIKRDSDE